MQLARQIVEFAIKAGSSDIHLEEGSPIAIRVNSDIKILDNILSSQAMDQLLSEILSEEKRLKYKTSGDLDTSIGLEGLSRIRINAYVANNKRCLTLRILPDNLPKWQDLGLPQPLIDLTTKQRGLVLCTGPTGSGKSTTLAAFINCILETQKRHILTIEDPIEFVYKSDKSLVHQRQLNEDTRSFSNALRAALREDPDVILVGEMRDQETISAALTAAETGHLVLATLHTNDAVQTIDRIIDVFPSHQQDQVRSQLAASLQAVVSQRLLRHKNHNKRIAAFEIMVGNHAICNMIRDNKMHQALGMMEASKAAGMVTMDSYLKDLYLEGLISGDEVARFALNPKYVLG